MAKLYITGMNNDPGDWREAARAEYEARRADAMKRRDQAAQRMKRIREKLSEAEAEIEELDRGARVFGLVTSDHQPNLLVTHDDGSQRVIQMKMAPGAGKSNLFKDYALAALEKHYPRPVKAGEIQQWAEAELGRGFHWKTAGMTLYRLKKEGTATRYGQNWFWVPPEERHATSEKSMGHAQPDDVDDLLGSEPDA